MTFLNPVTSAEALFPNKVTSAGTKGEDSHPLLLETKSDLEQSNTAFLIKAAVDSLGWIRQQPREPRV